MSLYNLPAFPKKVMWQEMLRHELLATLDQRPVVIVPVGSIEQHGPHCPMDVDISTPFHLAVAAAQAIDDFPVIVAPPQQYGFTHYNMGEIGTITLSLETFFATLNDIARSIWANGFRRIIMLNGHGGNEQPNWAAAVKIAEEDVWVLALTYWHMADPELLAWSEADAGSIGHAGEWETSLQLYMREHLVDMDRAVEDPWRGKWGAESVRLVPGAAPGGGTWGDGQSVGGLAGEGGAVVRCAAGAVNRNVSGVSRDGAAAVPGVWVALPVTVSAVRGERPR